MNKNLPVKIILFISISLCLFLFFRTVDMERIGISLEQAGYICFILCLCSTGISYLLATLAWKVCMNQHPKISLAKLFLVRHIGEVITLLNPASIAGGEAAKVFLLKKEGVGTKDATVSVIASRAILIATQLLLFFILVLILVCTGTRFPAAVNIFIGVFFLLIVTVVSIIYLLLKSSNRIKTPSWILSSRRLQKIWVQIKEVYSELIIFRREQPVAVKRSVVYGTLHWILGGLEFYIILYFLGTDASVVDAIFIDIAVVFFKSAGAFIPGQIGIEELGNKILLEAVGVPGTEIWITASLLRRARQLCWIAFGIVAWLLLQKKQNQPAAGQNGIL